jgi:hypothetical protein
MKLRGLVMLFLVLIPTLVSAQDGFSGTFSLKATQYDADGKAVREAALPMAVSPNRIRMIGVDKLDPTAVTRNLGAKDVLIRLDQQDFIFQTSDTEAIAIKKQELQLMMNMLGASNGTTSKPPANLSVRQTQESKTLSGYATSKTVILDRDSNIEHHAWIAKNLNVNLGMLTESWTSMLPLKDIASYLQTFDQTGTPLLVESFRDGKKISQVEMIAINTRFDRKLLDVPSGVKLITLQEMMLNRMRNY